MDYLFTYLFVYAGIGIGVCCILGAVTKSINESKGYDGGFAWGFWLGVIGIIVVACRQPADYTPRQSIIRPAPPVPSEPGSWKCSCGRFNAPYASSCVCGLSKRQATLPTPAPAAQPAPAPRPVVITSGSDDGQIIATLKGYKELLDSGVITQEEFDEKKKAILSR